MFAGVKFGETGGKNYVVAQQFFCPFAIFAEGGFIEDFVLFQYFIRNLRILDEYAAVSFKMLIEAMAKGNQPRRTATLDKRQMKSPMDILPIFG